MSQNLSAPTPQSATVQATEQGSLPIPRSSVLRLKGVRAMIVWATTTGVAFFSQFFSLGRRILEGLQGYDYIVGHNTKSAGLLFWLFSPSGAMLLTGLFLLAFLITTIRTFIAFQNSIQAALTLPIGVSVAPIVEQPTRTRTAPESAALPANKETPKPNLVTNVEWISAHEEYGCFMEGLKEPSRYDLDSNVSLYVVRICNEFDPSRQVGSLGNVSARIIYTRPDRENVKVHRGSWIGTSSYKVDFGVNEEHSLIIAGTPRHVGKKPLIFFIRREIKGSYENVTDLVEFFEGDSYQVKVSLINEARAAVHKELDYRLTITREPEFKIDLTEIRQVYSVGEIRAQLERFLDEGKGLLKKCERGENGFEEREIEAWEKRVTDYLVWQVAASDKIRFLSNTNLVKHHIHAATSSHRRLLDWINTRIARLEEIIIEYDKTWGRQG